MPGTAGVGATGRGYGFVGMVTALIGVIALIVSFLGLNWISVSGTTVKFSDLHTLASDSSVPEVSHLYFGWLGWTLAIVGVIVALIANCPTPVHGGMRALGLLIGVAGAVLTFFALDSGSDTSLSDVLKDAGVGFWVAIGGFVLIAIGAATGPRHVRS